MRIRLRRSSTSAPESTTGDVTERHRRPWANVRYPLGAPELEVQRIVDVAQNGQIGAPAADS